MLKLTDKSELSTLSKGNETMEEVKRTLEDMSSPELFTEYERKQLEEYSIQVGMMSARKEGYEEGVEVGKAQGEKNKAIENAISMLKDNVPISNISKWTGLSVEELKKLKEELS